MFQLNHIEQDTKYTQISDAGGSGMKNKDEKYKWCSIVKHVAVNTGYEY